MKSMLPFLFALGTALCWGMYGGVLANARTADSQASPFKPYVGIGVAYLVIAIGGGLLLLFLLGRAYKPNFNFFDGVSYWGFIAGSLGALGALSLTAAMFSGGAKMPHAVMPVVFGGAVTVAALFAVGGPVISKMMKPADPAVEHAAESHEAEPMRPLLWVGIAGMGISAILIAANTPHGHPKKKGPAATEAASPAETDAGDSH